MSVSRYARMRLTSLSLQRFLNSQTPTNTINCSTKCLKENPQNPQTLTCLYNAIIRASIEKGSPHKALLDYRTLFLSRAAPPNHWTLAYVLEACRLSWNLETAMQTHARIIKSGFELLSSLSSSLIPLYIAQGRLVEAQQLFDEISKWGVNIVSANLLIAGYLRIGEYETARRIFSEMPKKDVVSWNSMIAGCVRSGRPKEAISLFGRMLSSNCEPDEFTFSSILSACARVGALHHGECAHRLMMDRGIELNFILCSALIDMYSKCGRIRAAMEIFNAICRDNVCIWNSMITGLASHGLGLDAIAVFSRMEGENVSPDSITFVGILTACSHCGMVEKGRHYFDAMKSHYSIEPRLEHYGAMVDLLGRAGLLEEAYKMVETMPIKPDIVMWRALLSACRTHGKPELGELVIKQMEHSGSGDYVLLSNIFSLGKRWDCAEQVRELMKTKGVRKSRGLSWVEMGGVVHEFKAGDRSHPETDAIYKVLDRLIVMTKAEGFAPATELVLMDVSDEEKEGNLNCHSEKLAVAFTILRTGPRTEIRVSKNLRTCNDCHNWMKIVSRVVTRAIIVRDRIRFHHFEDGLCSCRDYW
ncbi:hypothetical protein AAC387_Pa02g0265 [Persea americana]